MRGEDHGRRVARSRKSTTSSRNPIPAIQPTHQKVKEMVRELLAERFGLTFHRDSKELVVYTLIVGKSGPGKRSHVSVRSGTGMRALVSRASAMKVKNATIPEF